jgi:methylmalonyl-CoA mutase, N-terminal domain
VEALTGALEQKAWELIEQIDAMGGAVAAIEQGWVQGAIADAAYEYQRRVESGAQVVVGVNRFVDASAATVPVVKIDETVAREQAAALARLRAERDVPAVTAALDAVRATAAGSDNILYPIRAALAAQATVGEVCGVLRQVWGEYQPEVRL